MSRRSAREVVFKLVFEFSFLKERNEKSLELFLADAKLTEDDRDYIVNTYRGIAENYDRLLAVISDCTEGYVVERIYRPDLAALILAAFELIYLPEVPSSVAISEAVELVKRYSSEKSNKFVNGVLASVLKATRGADDGK